MGRLRTLFRLSDAFTPADYGARMKGRLAFLDSWYEGTKRLAGHRRAEPMLAAVSFAESSFFPIPPDVMLIPMVQSRPDRWWRIALLCTLASVLGGIAGYALGYFFFEAFAQPVLERLGKMDSVADFNARVAEHGGIAVFGAALTPFPYKVITIMSGFIPVGFGVFMAASVIGRSMRFFLVAWIVRRFGEQAERIMKEHFALFTVGIFALAALLYWLLHSLL